MADVKQSRTARQALMAAEGIKKRVALAWCFIRKPGKMQRRPYITFYSQEDYDKTKASFGEEDFIFIQFAPQVGTRRK